MNSAELGNLTLRARAAYAIMCFERYVAFVYSDADFQPAAEMMWHLVDGSAPLKEAAERFRDMIPENLFVYQTYDAYAAAGHVHMTKEQYSVLTRVLNSYDWNLNSMMKQIHQLVTEYEGSAVTPGAPETRRYLENIEAILKARSIALPDVSLLHPYVCPQPDSPEAQCMDWTGAPVDPTPLSLFGVKVGGDIVEVRFAVPEGFVKRNRDLRSNIDFTSNAVYNDCKNIFERAADEEAELFDPEPLRPIAEANGCQWEYIEDPDHCIITRCINRLSQKEVTVPSELCGKPVTEIDDDAFSCSPEYGCMMIETLILPETIRQIGDCFCKGCTDLRQITLPANLESIGHQAFRGASRLESLAIGDQCQVIGDYFCADALSLRTVTIGTGIEYIGEYTFYNTPAMISFRCEGMLRELGYGSFWVNRWADKILFHPTAELLRFCKDDALLYRYVKRTPPPRLFFDAGITYVYDFAFGGDAWHSGDGITDIYFPGAEKIGVQAFKKVPNATVHLSASRMEAAYGPDYEYTLEMLCKPAKVVFDQP